MPHYFVVLLEENQIFFKWWNLRKCVNSHYLVGDNIKALFSIVEFE